MEAKKIVDLVVRAAEEHKGIDLEILDVSQLSIVADYFVVVSGRSTLHVDALTKAILDEIEANGVPVKNREGSAEGGWVLIDLYDVLVHIFSEEKRQYYSLEKLWQSAPKVES